MIRSILALTLMTTTAFAASLDITGNLANRELLYTKFKQVTYDLSDIQRQSALKSWISAVNKTDPGYLKGQTGVYNNLKNEIKNKALIDLVAHYYYVNDVANAKNAIEFYFNSVATYLWEISQNPIYADYASTAKSAQGTFAGVTQLRSCLDSQLQTTQTGKREKLIQAVNGCVNPSLRSAVAAAREIITDKWYSGPNFVQHYTGFIGGNKVEQLTSNPNDPQTILSLATLNSKLKKSIPQGGKKSYVDMTVDDFKALMPTPDAALSNLLLENEGVPKDHHIYSPMVPGTNEKNIFGEIYKSIQNAQESIFIDVFFLGGSMGTSLAKKLIEKSQSNPNLSILILNDRNNPLGYDPEMRIAYNYLRAYSEKFQPKLYILKPNIALKRTALPPFVDLLVDDNAIKSIMSVEAAKQLIDKSGGYPKGKSDHSKVFVIDGLRPTGVAYVGSKNLTDSSGAIATDESTRIQGPAVQVVLDSYYYDLLEAFTLDKYKKSESKDLSPQQRKELQAILAPVDVLGRYKGGQKVLAETAGNTLLQVGENNVYGTVRSPLEQDINLILNAKNQIIISDQFLYEAKVVEAIRAAVQKNNNLKVYIILASLVEPVGTPKAFAHVPNNVFIGDLTSMPQVKVKWKITPAKAAEALGQVQKQFGENLAPEYHLKAISIDGVSFENRQSCASGQAPTGAIPVMISGSANKDNMTMSGGFREFQVLVYDKLASSRHDCAFWSRWQNPDETEVAVANQFTVPPALASKGVTPDGFLKIIRSVIIYGYNFVETYF